MEIQNLPWYGQLLVFLVVGAVLFGIFYFIVYSPTQDEINSIVAQSEKLQDEIRKAEKNESKLEKLKEEKALNEKILEDLKGILPEKKEVSQILRKIQAIASNARLKTVDLHLQQGNQPRHLPRMADRHQPGRAITTTWAYSSTRSRA